MSRNYLMRRKVHILYTFFTQIVDKKSKYQYLKDLEFNLDLLAQKILQKYKNYVKEN